MPNEPNHEEATLDLERKGTTRRRFIKGATAATGAAVLSTYVKPDLKSIGLPSALAVSPGGEEPPPVLGNACSLELRVTASCSDGAIIGQVCVTNVSDDDGACLVTGVSVLVEPKGSDNNFGPCGSPEETIVSASATGGSNSLDSGDIIPGPSGTTTCFTLAITSSLIHDTGNGADYKVHVVVSFEPHHQFPDGRETQVCTTVEC